MQAVTTTNVLQFTDDTSPTSQVGLHKGLLLTITAKEHDRSKNMTYLEKQHLFYSG